MEISASVRYEINTSAFFFVIARVKFLSIFKKSNGIFLLNYLFNLLIMSS